MIKFRVLLPVLLCLAAVIVLALINGALPEKRALPGPQSTEWFMPPGQGRVPVVLLLEESSPSLWDSDHAWIDWLLQRGVAVIRLRDGGDRQAWLSGACRPEDGHDLPAALRTASAANPRIDPARFALMGAGRQGSTVLNSAAAFSGSAAPAAVIALYPGCLEDCPLDYGAGGPTQIHILYGSDDDWGHRSGTADRCRARAGGRIAFHDIRGAGHGFDRLHRHTEVAKGLMLRHVPDALATEIARSIVWSALALAWEIDN
jgi:dienelactone hydrolase